MSDPLSLSFGLTFDEAIAAAEARDVVLPDEYYDSLQADTRRLAFTVSNLSGLEQITDVFASLNAALAGGQTLRQWQASVADADWGLSKALLETIFRTNVQTSYMAGHWRSFEDNEDTQPYLMYSAINDARTRPAHRAMSGHIAPVHDALWDTWSPPCGYNCRCTLIALTEDQAVARGYVGDKPPPQNVQPDPGFGGHPTDAQQTVNDLLVEQSASAPPGVAAQIGSNLGHFQP